MIQFNLLPDVKMKYIKARRQKRGVILVASIVGAGALGVLILMLTYTYGIQGAQIADLNKKIKTSQGSISKKNQQVDDINKVLTVQNQLQALDTLHSEKPLISRTFEYLAKLTPSNITISKLDVTGEDTPLISMQGSTDTLESINRFVDTLKFTTFKPEEEGSSEVQVFSSVVLSSFSRDKAGSSYALSFTYDPIIFKSTSKVSGLVVPTNKVTTRSELGRPIIQTESEQENNAPEPAGGSN